MAALAGAPRRAAALERNEGLILQGLDTFARDHISHLCSRLIRQGSLQPVYLAYDEPRLPQAVQRVLPKSDEGAIDRSNETAKQLADRYATILSEDANKLSAAHFRACQAHGATVPPVPAEVSVILVSRTETQEFGVYYHRLGDVPETDVIALSTDLSAAARALAQAWSIDWVDESVDRPTSWHQWLRGAVPGALVALGSSVPFFLAHGRVNQLAADCSPGTRREDCDFDSRARSVRALDAWHEGLLLSGAGLSVGGAVLCGAFDVCLWPASLWFGDTAQEGAARSSTLRVHVGVTAIRVQGDF